MMIRATAAWAIRMIAGKESNATLEEALRVESDDTVKTEIEKALNQ